MDLHQQRIERAETSLAGLALGDCFGESYFVNPDVVESLIEARALASAPWHYTDDTLMAMSIVSVLRSHRGMDQDVLAHSFAEHYDTSRGYGPAMHRVLRDIGEGRSWRECAAEPFGGQGSWGNGAAMRVAPLGAFYADDLEKAADAARRSAIVTHTHPEAVAGAIAVAVAAAQAYRVREDSTRPDPAAFLDMVLPWIPDSEVRSRVQRARDMSANASPLFAVSILGNGTLVSAQDTVPLALWCAAHHLDSYEEALWLTVRCLGDRDTTCAIVGGIVVLYTGLGALPREWCEAAEPLPRWPFAEPWKNSTPPV